MLHREEAFMHLETKVKKQKNLFIALFRSIIFDSASIAFFSLSLLTLLVSSYFFSVSSIFFSRELTKAYKSKSVQCIISKYKHLQFGERETEMSKINENLTICNLFS